MFIDIVSLIFQVIKLDSQTFSLNFKKKLSHDNGLHSFKMKYTLEKTYGLAQEMWLAHEPC